MEETEASIGGDKILIQLPFQITDIRISYNARIFIALFTSTPNTTDDFLQRWQTCLLIEYIRARLITSGAHCPTQLGDA